MDSHKLRTKQRRLHETVSFHALLILYILVEDSFIYITCWPDDMDEWTSSIGNIPLSR